MSERPLPLLRDAAVIDGWAAYWLAWLVSDDVVARMARHQHIPHEHRQEVLAALDAIRTVANRWSASQVRNNEGVESDEAAPSGSMKASEAAQKLGVGLRRVQQLAPELGGRKEGGRWWFDRDRIEEFTA